MWITSAAQQDGGGSEPAFTPRSPPTLSVLPPSALYVIGNLELFARAQPVKADPVSSAPDLKRVFDEYKDSGDPRQRRAAARAFQTCVPAFVSSHGTPPSTMHLTESLAPNHRAEREAAYRLLFERCEKLVALELPLLTATLQALRTDPRAQAPGLLAQQAAMVGYPQRVEQLVKEALTTTDPAAVASLAGLTARIAVMREGKVADAALLAKARAVDEALPLVACDLGLDCGERSLWSLQLCAIEGLCEGDVPARLLERSARTGVKNEAVQTERLRLVHVLQSGRVAGTIDLLPEQ